MDPHMVWRRVLTASVTGSVLLGCSEAAHLNGGVNAGADAGAPDSAALADGCTVVPASRYDQSCSTDSDCVMVGEVTACPATRCSFCASASINRNALAQFQADIADDMASVPARETCSCPPVGLPCCRSGHCQQNGCSFPASDTLGACADAGGVCTGAFYGCAFQQGPAHSCAYADEVCCVAR
jgi:hypothetical protein